MGKNKNKKNPASVVINAQHSPSSKSSSQYSWHVSRNSANGTSYHNRQPYPQHHNQTAFNQSSVFQKHGNLYRPPFSNSWTSLPRPLMPFYTHPPPPYHRPDVRFNGGQYPWKRKDDQKKRPPREASGTKSLSAIEEQEYSEREARQSLEVQSKVELLKQSLLRKRSASKPRQSPPNESNSEDRLLRPPDDQGPPSKIQRLLDLNVNNDDYRDIGSGRIPSLSSSHDVTDTNPAHESIDEYFRLRADQYFTKRPFYNNQTPSPRAHPPLASTEATEAGPSEESFISDEPRSNPEAEAQKRQGFERVAERLKPLVLRKDAAWLKAMVNNAHKPTQKILLSKLLEENRSSLSRAFNVLRLQPVANRATHSSSSQNLTSEVVPADQVAEVEIDFSSLPDSFVITIENLIKRERPEIVDLTDECLESQDYTSMSEPAGVELKTKLSPKVTNDDDIVEVPVPPKPPPIIVDLDEDLEEVELRPNPEVVEVTTIDEQSQEVSVSTEEREKTAPTTNLISTSLPENSDTPSPPQTTSATFSPRTGAEPPAVEIGEDENEQRVVRTHGPVDRLVFLTEEENIILNELASLDTRQSQLTQQLSELQQLLQELDQQRPEIMARLRFLAEMKRQTIEEITNKNGNL